MSRLFWVTLGWVGLVGLTVAAGLYTIDPVCLWCAAKAVAVVAIGCAALLFFDFWRGR
jgi:hypothetical protein